jgi:transposase InsO family protein
VDDLTADYPWEMAAHQKYARASFLGTSLACRASSAPRWRRARPTARYVTHMFDLRCQENGIEHRLTKIKHPWTNGQVERMNRTIKEATVQRYYYDRHVQLEAHLADFITPYDYARRLKTLKGLTPYECICKCWTSQQERFKLNPLQQMPGLNT